MLIPHRDELYTPRPRGRASPLRDGAVRERLSLTGLGLDRCTTLPDYLRLTVAPVRTVDRFLLERDGDLSQITTAFDGVTGCGSGQLVVVEAAAGLGKTSLLAAALASASERGFDLLSARGSELERDFSFGVVRQLFEPKVATADDAERDALFAGAARLARPLWAIDALERPAADAMYTTLHGLYWLLANLASRRPLCVAVDDLHWADGSSVRFLAFVTSRLEELSMVLLLAMRPAEPGSEMLAQHLSSGIESIAVSPRPLSAEATAQLTAARLGQEPECEFVQACHAATAGNPFFIEALLRELALQDISPTGAQAARVARLGPRAVSRAVVMRLARVPGGPALARAIAVLGDGAELAHAAQLADLQADAAAKTADALIRAAILKRSSRLEFVHPIVRQAVYGDLAPHERAEQHALAARLLATHGARAERLAAQLLHAQPAGEDWVITTLAQAAQDALARGAPETASEFLRRALAERPAHCDALLLRMLGAAEAQLGQPEAFAHLEQAMHAAPDGRSRALAVHDLALMRGLGGDVALAVELFEEAIDLVTADERELALEFESELQAVAMFDSSCGRKVRTRMDRLQSQVSGQTIAERALLGQFALNEAMRCVPVERVADLAERALETPRWIVGRFPEAPQYFHAVAVLVNAGRYDFVTRQLEQAVEAGRSAGSPMTVAVALYHRSRLGLHRGSLREAESDAEESVTLVDGHPWKAAQDISLTTLIEILLARGELAAAERIVTERSFDGEIQDGLTYNFLLHARGALRLAQGRTAEAREDLLEYHRREHDWFGANPGLSAYRSQAARALQALGEHEHARQLAEEALERAHAFGAPHAIGVALCTCGSLQGDRGLELLAEAVRVLEPTGARLELARALVEHGTWLRRANRRADARAPLSRGHDIAQACGADGLAEQAAAELQATGARPRRRTHAGRDALTPSERRIAAMAADGLSNPKIAQSLFVSLKTVETHLGSVYRKLDIHSRSELPTVLAERAPRPSP